MLNYLWLRRTLLLLPVIAAGANAAPVIPTVYQDQYVLVRAGVNEVGRQPIHVGDLLSLELRIRFDSRNVRVQRFDSEYFQRGFSGQTGIRLFAPPVVTHEVLEGSLMETRAKWSFQILDCPAEQEICAGDKNYDLPVISTSYQLIDQFGQTLNDKSFRFRPWPDRIVVSPALPSSAKSERGFADYFPAGAYPDLLPVEIDDSYIDAVRDTLPELPDAKQQRFIDEYGLKAEDASILTTSRALADYFEAAAAAGSAKAQMVANWVMGDLSAALNRDGVDIEASKIAAADLAGLLDRIADNTISGKIAKEVFDAMWAGEGTADDVIEARGLKQITDTSAIEAVVAKVIAANPSQVAEYQSGKDKLIGFFVGQVMKETGGKANPGQVNAILKKKLAL